MVQAGALYKGFCTMVTCVVALHIVFYKRLPSGRQFILLGGFAFTCSTVCISLSIYYKTARLYCNTSIPEFGDASATTQNAIIAFYAAIGVPVQICAITGFIIYIFIIRKLARMNITQSDLSNHVNYEIIIFTKRLVLYPVIYFIGWFPSLIVTLVIIITGLNHITIRVVFVVFAASTGLAISISYFYFQIPKTEKELAKYFFKLPATFNGSINDDFEEPQWTLPNTENKTEYYVDEDKTSLSFQKTSLFRMTDIRSSALTADTWQ
jgi:hypothetical protein